MEILQNTILKLGVRQGTNTDRLVTTFISGEPLYTIDTKRMFIGNGLPGGIPVGNLFQGTSTDITTYTSSIVGDSAFNSDSGKLYRLKFQTPNALSSWECVGGVYSAGDDSVTINSSNVITLNPLSGGKIHASALAVPIVLNSNSQITLSSKVPCLEVVPLTGSSIKIPTRIQVGPTTFSLQSSAPLAGQFPQFIDGTGTMYATYLRLSSMSTNTITVSSGLTSTANGLSSTGLAINPLSANIVIQSNQLFAKYNGLSAGGLVFSRGVTTVNYLSAGHYKFNYADTGSANMISTAQVFGIDAPGYDCRTIAINNSACHIKILNASASTRDVNLTLSIIY